MNFAELEPKPERYFKWFDALIFSITAPLIVFVIFVLGAFDLNFLQERALLLLSILAIYR